MYEPQEDSFLLQKYARRYSKGIVLDIGTGTGIQAEAAAENKRVVKVFAVDIDEDAIIYCIRHVKNKKIVFFQSDLFVFFKRARANKKRNLFEKNFELKLPKDLKFDTIIFNPPYLPREKPEDIALDGGEKGYEILQKFFKDAKEFLKPAGNILIVFSSLTDKDKVDIIIEKNGFKSKLLEQKHIFFEDLYVYLVTNEKHQF